MTDRADGLNVVFGATGAIGSCVVTELVHAGREVRAVSRGGQAPNGTQGVAADASDPAQAARVAVGASVIYHCASPPYTQWPELFPPLTHSILDAAESTGAKLVFADNLYAYGPVNGPLREDLPAIASGRKGRTRVEMAAELLAAHRNGQARVVVGRASDYTAHTGLARPRARRYSGGSWPERSRNGPGASTSRTLSTTYRTSPADWWFSLTGRKPMVKSGIFPRRGR